MSTSPNAPESQDVPPAARRSWRGPAAAVALAAALFAAVAPTLAWSHLQSSLENLNLATVLDIRRGGPWLVPTLQGVPRLAKPPLTAWLTTAFVRPATIAALDDPDPAARRAAYDRLALRARLPALLAACGILLATFALGRAVDGDALGLAAAAVCATTFLFLRHCRLGTTDVQLALWVAVANAMLAAAVFRGRRWAGSVGAGVALGLAFMAKGPVGLAQTVLPFGIYLLLRRRDVAGDAGQRAAHRQWIGPAAVGLALTLLIGGWWYAWVAWHFRGMGALWVAEVSRVDADDVPPQVWFNHFASLYLFVPWVVWLGAGIALAVRELAGRGGCGATPTTDARRRATPAVLALLLLLVPLVPMSFVKDRFQRYLVPMAPAGGLLAACAIVGIARGRGRRDEAENDAAIAPASPRAGDCITAAHWLVLGGWVIGSLLLAGFGRHSSYRTADGAAWLSKPAAVGWAALCALAIIAGVYLNRRWRGAGLVVVTVAVILVAQAGYYRGIAISRHGRSQLLPVAELIRARYPDAVVYVRDAGHRNQISFAGNELSIYLNRPLRWATKPFDVPPDEAHPQIWFMTQPKRSPDVPAPPGWQRLAKLEGGSTDYVFVRPNASSQRAGERLPTNRHE